MTVDLGLRPPSVMHMSTVGCSIVYYVSDPSIVLMLSWLLRMGSVIVPVTRWGAISRDRPQVCLRRINNLRMSRGCGNHPHHRPTLLTIVLRGQRRLGAPRRS